nr:hypothetical protein [Tanacetum cinerariifolium]
MHINIISSHPPTPLLPTTVVDAPHHHHHHHHHLPTHLHNETKVVVSEFHFALSGFEIDKQAGETMISNLKDHAIGNIKRKAREEAAKVSTYMKDSEMLDLALGGPNNTQDILVTNTWGKVLATKTLVTLVECISVWNQLLRETEYTITQAIASQFMDDASDEGDAHEDAHDPGDE